MLWSFEKGTIITTINTLYQQKHMSITGLMRRQSLIGIDAVRSKAVLLIKFWFLPGQFQLI